MTAPAGRGQSQDWGRCKTCGEALNEHDGPCLGRRQMATPEWFVFDSICACPNKDGLHACDVTAVRVVERLRREGLLPDAASRAAFVAGVDALPESDDLDWTGVRDESDDARGTS